MLHWKIFDTFVMATIKNMLKISGEKVLCELCLSMGGTLKPLPHTGPSSVTFCNVHYSGLDTKTS